MSIIAGYYRELAVTDDWRFERWTGKTDGVQFAFVSRYPFVGEWSNWPDEEVDFGFLDSHGMGTCSPYQAWEWFGPDALNTVFWIADGFTPPEEISMDALDWFAEADPVEAVEQPALAIF